MERKKTKNRREFIRSSMRFGMVLALGGVGGLAFRNAAGDSRVWQIDPDKCSWCGRCATHCVISPSAVKCVHAYSMCGYCDLCGGYLIPGHSARSTAAENQLCPTAAIERKFIEEPYYEYKINEDLCIGCGKCVEGCSSFGNGSMQLQVMHHLCVNCNECSIARVCPSDAIKRVGGSDPYLLKGGFSPETDQT
jgi:Na+-translocating ferredoxin:NAD+ oxidoreductase subunit B